MGKNKHKTKGPRGPAPPGNSFSEGAGSRQKTPGNFSTAELLALTYGNRPAAPQTSGLLADYVGDTLLLVGEGDFSFAAAVLQAFSSPTFRPPGRAAPRLIATTLDSLAEATAKYGGGVTKRVSALQKAGHVVICECDATELSSRPELEAVSGSMAIVFNFPHVSGASSQTEDIRHNRELLRAFFREARALLGKDGRETGRVVVALRNTPFYESWDLVGLANRAKLVLAKPREQFQGDSWLTLGYSPVRTNPAVREAPSLQDAHNYVFRLAREGELPESEDSAEKGKGTESP
ncbi:hypothetical protein DFJ74DRAFT_703938 [Hyaloraphidium curvatum]|nr:hypothetical protein DFJ74DRAFT_703938 [Hyaloraphidium curvatum]